MQVTNVKIKNEGTCGTTGYGQGTGSGAGYVEISNGVFKSINEQIGDYKNASKTRLDYVKKITLICFFISIISGIAIQLLFTQ